MMEIEERKLNQWVDTDTYSGRLVTCPSCGRDMDVEDIGSTVYKVKCPGECGSFQEGKRNIEIVMAVDKFKVKR